MKKLEPENIERYGKHYDENRLWNKLGTVAKRAGSKVVYPVLLLYYVLQDKKTPLKHISRKQFRWRINKHELTEYCT